MRVITPRREVQLAIVGLFLSFWFIPPKTYTGKVSSVETQNWTQVTK